MNKQFSLNVKKTLGYFLLMIFLLQGFSIITFSVLKGHPQNGNLILLIDIAIRLAVAVIIVLLVKKNEGFLGIKLVGYINKKWILATAVFTFGLHILNTQLTNFFLHIFPLSDKLIRLAEHYDSNSSLVTIILRLILIAPITEELIYRGIFVNGLSKLYSKKTTFILTAVLFAISHGTAHQIALAFITGIFLAWLYLKTESLLLTIGVHMAMNGLLPFISLLGIHIEGYTNVNFAVPSYHVWWWDMVGIVCLVLGVILYRNCNNKINNAEINTNL
ncbi:CPBP family intramembrane metalloprotease [Clostridium sp. 'deep sea']|uniref:CPBP family intramembrane glutamic endopeptidase n=1 Tax=Clostridium sp. 'deep sea' TaxID=2779445 RepID=UPI00189689E7|nr:type II CAAX endopeptidase family protein [Clostridium sp. 'deep sea']QOR34805.1 CPBP family intramembrane metalloprotease [Clostridium sp. 'deep sea']